MRCPLIAVGLMISLATRVVPLAAQSDVSVGVGAGLVMPRGSLRDETNPGVRVLGSLDLGMPEMPASLRVEAAYDRLGFKAAPLGAAGEEAGARTIASGSLGLALGPRNAPPATSPYIIAGLGINRIGCTGRENCDTSTQIGWNGGVGARFTLFARRAFTEARIFWVPGSVSDLYYLPLTVGLSF